MTWYPWVLASWVAAARPIPELAPEMNATVCFLCICRRSFDASAKFPIRLCDDEDISIAGTTVKSPLGALVLIGKNLKAIFAVLQIIAAVAHHGKN